MNKILCCFIFTFILNFSVFGQEKDTIPENGYLFALAGAKGGVGDYPLSIMFHAGYERRLFRFEDVGYLTVEGRVRGGLTFWRDYTYAAYSDKRIYTLTINDYLIGPSLLPRFYLQIADNGFIFLDGEIGMAYHIIETGVSLLPEWKKAGNTLTPSFGFHIGGRLKRTAVWAGLFTTDSKSKINRLLPQDIKPVSDNIEFEFGIGFCF